MRNIAEVGALKVSLSLDSASFTQSMQSVNANLKNLKSELALTKSGGKDFEKSLEGMRAKSDVLTRTFEAQKQKVSQLKAEYEESVRTKGADDAATQKLATQYNYAAAQMNKTEAQLKSLNGEIQKQSSSFTQAGLKMQEFGNKLKGIGEGMTNVGKSLTTKVSLPVTGLGVAAFKAAVDFESAFAGVRKTVDASEAEFAVLSKGIRNMAKEIPAAATEIAAVAESAGQLGIKREDILQFTRVMVDLGVATNMSSEEAATALARLANITQMPMENIDRLGATIVGLGNNLATTESEIVAMSLRLAGAGHQVGMSEAQILSLGGALSSVGIEAEAGGSAFSRVMIEMALASSAGEKSIKGFADVAGMSAKDFQKAFKEDAATAIITFIEGLARMSKEGENVFQTLDDLGLSEIRVRDALLRASGAGDLFRNSMELGNQVWKENTALTNEASERYKTTASQIKILWNNVKDLGIQFGEVMLPHAQKFIDVAKDWTQRFQGMSTETQEMVLKLGLFVAAAGPVLTVTGSIATGVGSLITAAGTASIAFGGAGGLAAAMSSFGTATLAVATGPVGIGIAALAALTVGGVALYKHMQKASFESQVFGDEVSEATQKAVGAYLELDEKATVAVNQLAWSQQRVTKEMADSITGTYNEMFAQIKSSMEESHAERIASIEEMLGNSISLTKREKDEIVASVKESQDQQARSVEEGQKRINEIWKQASDEKRGLTEREELVIATIQERMKTTAVKVMSESEAEQKAILERMKLESEKISSEQAAAVVKNSLKQKDQVVKEAEEQYQKTIAEIIRLRDESNDISAEVAEKWMRDAKEQRDTVVQHAESMHRDVIKEAKAQAQEHVNQVNWATGEIKTKWEALTTDMGVKSGLMAVSVTQKFKEMKDGAVGKAEEMRADTLAKIEKIKTIGSRTFDDLKIAVETKMGEAKGKVVAKWNEAEKFLLSINLGSIGKDIIQGLINGIESKAKDISTKVSNIANSIPKTIKAALNIQSPSKVTTKLGEDTGEGFARGISKKQKAAEAAAKKAATAATKRFKEAMDGASYKFKMDEVDATAYIKSLESVRANYAKTPDQVRKVNLEIKKVQEASAKELEKLRKEAAKKKEEEEKAAFEFSKNWIAARKQTNEMSLMEELAAWERVQGRYNEGTKQRIEADKAVLATKKNINDEMVKINDEYLKKVGEVNQKLIEDEKKLNQEYENALASRTNSLYSFAGIFDELKERSDVSGVQLMQNLRSQIVVFAEWARNIEELAEKGIDKGLLDELRAMGPKAAAEVDALNRLTDKQLQEYAGLWKTKNELARRQATSELEGLRKDTDKKISELHTNSANQLEKLRVEWDKKIKQIRTGTTSEFTAMNASMTSIGNDTIRGLMDGIKQMEGPLIRQARAIADSVAATMRDALKIKSPSRVTMEMGNFLGEGLEEGMGAKLKAVTDMGKKLAMAAIQPVGEFSMPSVSAFNIPYMDQIATVISAAFKGTVPDVPGDSRKGDVIIQQENNFYSTKPTPSEDARLQKRALQELAYNWR